MERTIRPLPPAAILIIILLYPLGVLPAEPLFSPTWGFYLDLPEGYRLSGGDGKDRFSLRSAEGALVDLAVYPAGTFEGVEALAETTEGRLGNRGDRSSFRYRDKGAVLLELEFSAPGSGGGGQTTGTFRGWGLCLELGARPGSPAPLLLALAYGPAEREDLHIFHLSALDSIAPSAAERRLPGPLTEFAYPRGNLKPMKLAGSGGEALIAEHDAAAAQALVDREFEILRRQAQGPHWKEAWIRFYRTVYRDSFERLADAAFGLERRWNLSAAGGTENRDEKNLDFAGKALLWVQSFTYERDLEGSDFVNPVSAALEGRGDCDSRALLWALVLEQANIPAAIMVSREYGHAMGLADLPGKGARFESGGKKWLVAETTASVSLGLIGEKVSDPAKWLGIPLD